MRFKIYGDRGYECETLLEDFDTYAEADRWFENYTKRDLGGYMVVELIGDRPDGSIIFKTKIDDPA